MPTSRDGRIFITALRNIAAGEELNYDYGLIIEERYTKKLKAGVPLLVRQPELPRHAAGTQARLGAAGPGKRSKAGMTATPAQWPAEAIWQAIEPLLPGFTVEVLPSIDSTSSELMRRARAGRQEPTLLVAEQQTAGRGRLGREWHTGAYEGTGVLPALTFSLGLPLAPRDWSGLSLAVGVSVAESLQPKLPAVGSGQPRMLLKWPNDLWLQDDRKLGGILVETASPAARARASRATWSWA